MMGEILLGRALRESFTTVFGQRLCDAPLKRGRATLAIRAIV
jgi:hypothetical protein